LKPAIESSAIEMPAPDWGGVGNANAGAALRMRPSRLMPPTAAWFVTRAFAGTFLGALGTFIVLDLLASFIDKFDDLMAFGLLRHEGMEYLLLKLPLMTAQLMPVACLAGVLLGLAMLNRNGELLALQGLGISRLGIALPLLIASVLLSLAAFALNETVVPASTRRSKFLLDGVILKQPGYGISIKNWLRTRNSFVAVTAYDAMHKRLVGIRVFEIGSGYKLRAMYSADSADWNGTHWVFSGLKGFGLDHDTITGLSPRQFRLDAKPADFSFALLSPEEYSLSELNAYIAKLHHNGQDPGAYLVDRDVKYALPLSCLVMMLCGLTLSLDPVPRSSSTGRGFILGLSIGLIYWITLGFTISFGRSGLIAPWLAAWTPNILFTILAVALFISGEER
jgi:lipopolysaccharide export system permease protein